MKGFFQSGMTLIEVMIAMLILSLVAVGLLYGVMAGVRLNYAASQRAAAFGLCVDLYEQMRGADYDAVSASNFPPETLRMTHLGGSQRVPLLCRRTCTISPFTGPTRKEVRVEVQWTYLGRPMRENLDGVLFKKQ